MKALPGYLERVIQVKTFFSLFFGLLLSDFFLGVLIARQMHSLETTLKNIQDFYDVLCDAATF